MGHAGHAQAEWGAGGRLAGAAGGARGRRSGTLLGLRAGRQAGRGTPALRGRRRGPQTECAQRETAPGRLGRKKQTAVLVQELERAAQPPPQAWPGPRPEWARSVGLGRLERLQQPVQEDVPARRQGPPQGPVVLGWQGVPLGDPQTLVAAAAGPQPPVPGSRERARLGRRAPSWPPTLQGDERQPGWRPSGCWPRFRAHRCL